MKLRWRRFRLGLRRRPTTRRQRAAVVAAAVLFVLWALHPARRVPTWEHEQILAAIRWVESSNRVDVPNGDQGLAIRPYQIHFVYWQDAIAHAPSLGGSYQDCRRRDYAERVIEAYMQRYAPDAWRIGDAETIARIHNGGPRGAEKATTLGYWQRVRQRLP
jgi:hypothetical protein